jgi:uncharacterized Fe-S center protein
MSESSDTVVHFASAVPKYLSREHTLPARFMRMLDRLPLASRVKGRTVAVKMHIGGGLGYSTVHPFFVKLLVDHLTKAGAKKVFLTDAKVADAAARGYAKETVGAALVDGIGANGRDVRTFETGWDLMPKVQIGNPILDADVLINLSHLKGHGDCGFGGACKNLAMGCVPPASRRAMHALEGKLTWTKDKCTHCNKCIEECESKANKFEDGDYRIFWHHCKMCLHCMLACPTGAIQLEQRKFDLFQEGLARVAKLVVDQFSPDRAFHINVLTQITIFCDCWGFTTPSLVPDIGIMASEDIVAVDHASLDAVREENLIPGSITPPYKLGKGRHLFEKLHGKDPYAQVLALERLGAGTAKYRVLPVE